MIYWDTNALPLHAPHTINTYTDRTANQRNDKRESPEDADGSVHTLHRGSRFDSGDRHRQGHRDIPRPAGVVTLTVGLAIHRQPHNHTGF
jgi:hypothetical protein